MSKTNIVIVVVLAVIVIIFGLGIYRFNFTDGGDIIPGKNAPDVKNMSYVIDGETFDLINGKAEKEIALGSISKNTVMMFGEPVYGDLNKDGKIDAAILLANDPGGSGTFYYAVLAINKGDGYQATNTMFLGDRIAPQTVEIRDGRAVYNFAERKAGEPMTAQPSIGKSVWINYDKATGEIGEWVKDFEGEADPTKITLGMKTWNWINTTYSNDTEIKPKTANKFTITFKTNKTFSATTDCNGVGGEYTVTGNKISFNKMMSTLMYCEGSQESDFTKMLGEVQSYMFTSKGELILGLKLDSGSMIFR
jgi:heat shock protein HslJ